MAQLIRGERRKQGLTQAELAARVGASRKWVVDLESGKRSVDLSLALRALNALGLRFQIGTRDNRRDSQEVSLDQVVALAGGRVDPSERKQGYENER